VLLGLGEAPAAETELRDARSGGAPDQTVLPLLYKVMLERHKEQMLLDEFPDPGAGTKGDAPADLLKARALVAATGHAAVADDTGLFVDALDGRPGVYSARYAGEHASYEDNVTKLLGEMSGVAAEQRTARFRSVIAVAYPDGTSLVVGGVLEGVVTQAARGAEGFGYDPVFAPTELGGRTLAELTPTEKNAVSHRARALLALGTALSS
jgi:XTP/dITP diphosphohydrolase